MYRLRLSRQAQKDLDRLPDEIWERVRRAVSTLRDAPRPPGCTKIRGQKDTYRLRIGDYRALYDIDDAAQTILILRVQHRREAYRDL